MDFSCPYCGGSRLEHLRNCPKVYSIISKKQANLKKDFFGASPNIFVGRYGYPDVNVGVLSNETISADSDEPRTWSEKNYSIPSIIDLRTELINSRFRTNVKSFGDKLLEITQETAMAKKPVDIEVHLNKVPSANFTSSNDFTPFGPSVNLDKAELTENPKIPNIVEKTTSDNDLKSVDAISNLYDKGLDEQYLTKLLSAGTLGIKRKLVPTRWSITAIDDSVGKKIHNQILDYNECDYTAHFGGYLGNYYLILFFPRLWSYELFETYVGEPFKTQPKEYETATDFEDPTGRKEYAKNTVGGYYAARLAILEHLKNIKRQGAVLALRFITDEYYMSLGVWVVREATRKSLQEKPIRFASEELMLEYSRRLVEKKFNFRLDWLVKQSRLIKMIKTQKRLSEF